MKINILNIFEEGLDLKFSLDAGAFSELITDREKFDFSLHRVDVSVSVRKVRQSVFFAGTIETIMETPCSRCLEMSSLPLRTEFTYTLLPEVPPVKDEAELKTEDLDVGYYAGEVIDLDPIIFEQLMLQIPMKVLCRDACKGLCPQCGSNLNTEQCDCRNNVIDERLAVLKNIKI